MMSFTPRKRPTGFSLIELLVAITVTAVLLSLLAPAVVRMRESSEASVCTANLRQLAAAGFAFAAEHGGMLSSSRVYNSKDDEKEPGLLEYFDNNKRHRAFVCPSLAGYGVAYTYTFTLAATSNDWGPTVWMPLRAIHAAEFPAQTAWMMDGRWNEANAWFAGSVMPSTVDVENLLYPHAGMQNVVFLDGHVEAVDAARLADARGRIWTGR